MTVRENSFIRIENRITIQDILVDHTSEEMEGIARRSFGPTAGFFKLESSRQLTPAEALSKCRRRVAVEHAISSLKNEVRMKPLRVWKRYSVRGRMILGF